MTANREVFVKDPVTTTIPNNGWAQVAEPTDARQLDVLRYELEAFVCDGEFATGLERILSTYLSSLGADKQPAVWVSGFYGSGKSHLVRVLEYLWRDYHFPDGTAARGLVSLPSDIAACLKELSTAGQREGGLWSTAGLLSATDGSVRLALLAIVLGGAGLPLEYAPARLVLWLKENGWYTSVEQTLRQQGKDLRHELLNMYASPVLAQALLDAVPNLGAANTREVRELMRDQWPRREDISDEDLLQTMDSVLRLESTTREKLPCSLIIFDELQQFIGEDQQRTLQVQDIVEACSSRFGSRLLFVGTGQAQLQATTALSKLQGRFTVPVMLSDQDVEKVVRQVVLQKQPGRVAELERAISAVRGEIDRQLAGTKIGPIAADQADLIPDYPLLPSRRRFWEAVLRAVDSGGRAGQLRTQLRVVHEAVRSVANKPLGWVVPGDYVYAQLETDLQQSGVLLRETATLIGQLDDGTADGRLRQRLCAAVYLIGQLPADGPAATGVRATDATLADLLVEDLNSGSTDLRQRIPVLLQGMVNDGRLMQIGDEYRLQTREGAEWDSDYRRRYARLQGDDSFIADARTSELRNAVKAQLDTITLRQGKSAEPRALQIQYGGGTPPTGDGVPVWIRDEWSSTERSVREDAQAAGVDGPIVYVFLPRRDADNLREALASWSAADRCVRERPNPSTQGGEQAKQSMASRAATARIRLNGLIEGVLAGARVYQGGGAEISEGSLLASVKAAAEASLVRLYPRFDEADDPRWGKVILRARDGAGDALTEIGYGGNVEQNTVCQRIRAALGAAGKRGNEIRREFSAPPFGWPRDAVDGALLALVAGGLVRASKNGRAASVKELDQTEIRGAEFQIEGITLSIEQKFAVRHLLTEAGFTPQSDREGELLPAFLDQLLRLAGEAGGPPPLPAPPSVVELMDLRGRRGNDQIVAVYDQRDELRRSSAAWRTIKQHISDRIPHWELLQGLLRQAERDPAVAVRVAGFRSQADAVRDQRLLLTDPDPIAPLLDGVSAVLRQAVQEARNSLVDERQHELTALEASEEWKRLPPDRTDRILAEHGLERLPELAVGTAEELLRTLDQHPLPDWKNRLDALPRRIDAAREAAAKLLEPEVVSVAVPRATLRTEQEVDAYVANLRALIMAEVGAGKPVLI